MYQAPHPRFPTRIKPRIRQLTGMDIKFDALSIAAFDWVKSVTLLDDELTDAVIFELDTTSDWIPNPNVPPYVLVRYTDSPLDKGNFMVRGEILTQDRYARAVLSKSTDYRLTINRSDDDMWLYRAVEHRLALAIVMSNSIKKKQ